MQLILVYDIMRENMDLDIGLNWLGGKNMICCVTGHRPKGFPFERKHMNASYEKYLSVLDEAFEDLVGNGCVYYISGMAYGADLDFADMVLDYRSMDKEILLEAALPYPVDLAKLFLDKDNEKSSILRDCDYIKFVSPNYYRGCMHKRNRYMVDKSDILLAIWNEKYDGGTWDTIKYAQKQGKTVKYIMLSEIGKFTSAVFK